jgi:biotin carboxyl carrier protein
MKNNIKVIVNGKPYEVEIEDPNVSPMTVMVNGQAYEVTLESDQPVSAPVVVKTATPVKAAPPRPVKNAPSASSSSDSMVAPMPGVIVDIVVKPGDKLAFGQQLCALEAMKMKNALRAPREVVIASVEVQEGQRVNYGDVLFKFTA